MFLLRDYELMYIIAPTHGDDEACAAFAEQMAATITTNGAEITPNEGLQPIGGRRKLAYAMRRESKDVHEGYYVLLQFQAEPAKIVEIERSIKLSDPIMRYLITLPSAEADKPVEQ